MVAPLSNVTQDSGTTEFASPLQQERASTTDFILKARLQYLTAGKTQILLQKIK